VAGLGGFFLAPALMGVVVGVYQVHKEEKMAMRIGEGTIEDLESAGFDGETGPAEPLLGSNEADDSAIK